MNNSITYRNNYLDPFFQSFFGEDINAEEFGSLAMKTDISEVGDNYVIDIDLPGFKKEDIDLALNEGYLTVSANVNRSFKEKKENADHFIRRERFSGSASRTYYVGDVTEDKIKAAYTDGVLSISFPKADFKKVEPTHKISIN
ncbi:MAG: Hsp20/alpha crystallin family protein [Bacilli bacterium]|nr:Hsp20/alpha crystallin family protein [Bacilli bacterium]